MCSQGEHSIPEMYPGYATLIPRQWDAAMLNADMHPCYCEYYPHVQIAETEKIIYCCHRITFSSPGDANGLFEFKLPKGVRMVIGISGESSRDSSTQDIDQKLVLQFNAGKNLGGVYYFSSKTAGEVMPGMSYVPVTMPVTTGSQVQGWVKDFGFIPALLFPYTFTIILTCIAKRKYSRYEC